MAMAARMPMMATTIMSSMSVKPLASLFFICASVTGEPEAAARANRFTLKLKHERCQRRLCGGPSQEEGRPG
jgi:hypothetical protein